MLQHLSGGVNTKRRGGGREEKKKGRAKREEGRKNTYTPWKIEPTIFHMIAQGSYHGIGRRRAVIGQTD